MCEFCLRHGEGKTWYLQAKNYSEDLLSDIRRRKFIEDFFSDSDSLGEQVLKLAELDDSPWLVKAFFRRLVTRKMKKEHFGQVVPIEDIEKIFALVNSVVRVGCLCRRVTRHEEKRYCYAISAGPNGGKLVEIFRGVDQSYQAGPAVAGLEVLAKDEALAAMRGHEGEGLCHTIWTFRTPFICGVCNCDRSDCLAMRTTMTYSIPMMFRAEYVAEVVPDSCTGCRECMRVCQFGAVVYSAATRQASIDRKWCYGCGVCRSVCKKDAIRLVERATAPVAAGLW